VEELSALVELGAAEGELARDEQQLLAQVVELGTLRIRDVYPVFDKRSPVSRHFFDRQLKIRVPLALPVPGDATSMLPSHRRSQWHTSSPE
jgi:hypothetical protein